jgi:hypothetical protein
MTDEFLQTYLSAEARLFANPNLRDLALYKALGKEVLRNEVVMVKDVEDAR